MEENGSNLLFMAVGAFAALGFDWAAFEQVFGLVRSFTDPARRTRYFEGAKVRLVGVAVVGAFGGLCVAASLHRLLGLSFLTFAALHLLRYYEMYPEQRAFWAVLCLLGVAISIGILTGVFA